LTDAKLLDSFKRLWAEADAIWEANSNAPAYALYVSADYKAIFDKLCELRGRVDTILEWGSGLGVVTIMANRLGFDAYGIEAEPDLVKLAEGLASKYQATPRFVVGSFIPAEFEEDLPAGEEFGRTLTTATPAYEELDMELRDFDLVYAYPWPDEHGIYRSIMRRHASRHALYMRYDAREGLVLTRVHPRGDRLS
jgi:SAM-dependent methyltransferase